ncbi:MAG: hypothetical protein HOP12_13310 [Candidatus Eisenbacteria bacterium]|uniref:Lipoprotein n=1 Tax=Eiseniibacteriota bacterium TaxID=2212470 RepID=A0A849SUS3_UNCEI|nr:hypothetical protein [Candidatus Eisenbacteria bacterium]
MSVLRRAVLLGGIATLALGATGCAMMPWRRAPEPRRVQVATWSDSTDSTRATSDSLAAGPDSLLAQHPLGLPAPRKNKPKPPRNSATADSIERETEKIAAVETVMSAEDRQKTTARVVADTSFAGDAARKCGGRTLLPDQETVFDAVRSMLVQTRTALQSGELWRAEQLARKARQLASSLDCP